MRLALFGGTFDPIHRGHIAIARAAADAFALDTVVFAPTGQQPLKTTGSAASYTDRLAMTKLACAADPRFAACDLDAPHPDGSPNYTVHTLSALALAYPCATLFNLVGLDSFLSLPRWHQPERLLALAEWIVVSRPGYTLDLTPYTPQQKTRIHSLDTVHEDVSATALRARLHQGDPCAELLPPPVAAYIAEQHLYRHTLSPGTLPSS